MSRRLPRNQRAFANIFDVRRGKPPRPAHWISARDMMRRVEAEVIPFALRLGWKETTQVPPRPGSWISYRYEFEQPSPGHRRQMSLFFQCGDTPAISVGCILAPGPRGYEDCTVAVHSKDFTDWPKQPYLDRLLRGPAEPPPETIETAVVNGTQSLALLQAFILSGATHPRLRIDRLRTSGDP